MKNICEYCKKENDGLYGTGRFCNSICAHGFSTKAKRKEINKKVSKALSHEIIPREIRKCVICGDEFRIKITTKQHTCGKKECKHELIGVSLRGISKNVGKNNPMYGKSPSHTKRYHFFSIKNNKEIILKSTYEIEAANILENDEDIINYQYEPFNIPYDKNRSTIPDFLVKYKDKTILIEVKPKRMLNLWNNKIKIHAMKNYCKVNNILFELWTEKNLAGEMLR